jgi:hypothetical protein
MEEFEYLLANKAYHGQKLGTGGKKIKGKA